MPNCEICGEPMPAGEEMFKYHGYSGNCPSPRKQPHPPHTPMPECNASTPLDELERQIMDSTLPKNEREWWAHREIERLRAELSAYIKKVGDND